MGQEDCSNGEGPNSRLAAVYLVLLNNFNEEAVIFENLNKFYDPQDPQNLGQPLQTSQSKQLVVRITRVFCCIDVFEELTEPLQRKRCDDVDGKRASQNIVTCNLFVAQAETAVGSLVRSHESEDYVENETGIDKVVEKLLECALGALLESGVVGSNSGSMNQNRNYNGIPSLLGISVRHNQPRQRFLFGLDFLEMGGCVAHQVAAEDHYLGVDRQKLLSNDCAGIGFDEC